MDITIEIDSSYMMYRTIIDWECYDARDGFKNIEDAISDAVCTFLYDPEIDSSEGFKVVFK